MTLRINQKLLLIMIMFFLIPLVMFSATLLSTKEQKNDGLVINLAGRQRMLSQKMSKECLAYFHQVAMKDAEGMAKTEKALKNTIAVFEVTLNALINSGPAPLSMDLEGKKSVLPAATGEAAKQLQDVLKPWESLKKALERVMLNQQEEDLQVVLEKNPPLLVGLDKAVTLMQNQAESKVKSLFLTQGICLGIALLMVVFVLSWSKRSIVNPVHLGVAFAQSLAEGDLSRSIVVTQKDEMGDLALALNNMSGNLNRMIRDITGAVETLASSSTEMSAISDEMASGSKNTVDKAKTVAAAAEEMNVNMDSVAAAMEEATTNVKTVAGSAAEMNSSIGLVARNTEQAREITRKAVKQTSLASDQVNELGQAAEEIGMVTETITAISDKTNLLALNATIEAARAGDAGKGFAVVANEIKELAKQTAQATGDISKKLKGIQKSTSSTVAGIMEVSAVMTQVETIVASIFDSVEQQRKNTEEITENVSQASLGLAEINENVNQSSLAVTQVTKEIIEVNESANQIDRSSSEVKQSAMELSRLAEQLKKMVQKFKV